MSPPFATVKIVGKTITFPMEKDKKHMVDARLNMQLDIRSDANFESRLCCESTFFLSFPGTNAKEELTATVFYSLFNKPSHCLSDANNALDKWCEDWINGKLQSLRYKSDVVKEHVWALRSLYNKDGSVKESGKSKRGKAVEVLYGPQHNDTLLFISKIITEEPFAGKGLLKYVIELLFQGITHIQLPDCCRISGPVCWVLEPGFIRDENSNAVWPRIGNESEDERFYRVTQILETKVYPKVGFDVYRTDAAGGKDTLHSYMGRRVFAHLPVEGAVVGKIEPLDSRHAGLASRSAEAAAGHKSLSNTPAVPVAGLRANEAAISHSMDRHAGLDNFDDQELQDNHPRVLQASSTLWTGIRRVYKLLSSRDWKWLFQSILDFDQYGSSPAISSASPPAAEAQETFALFRSELSIMPDGETRQKLLTKIAGLDAMRSPTPTRAAPVASAQAKPPRDSTNGGSGLAQTKVSVKNEAESTAKKDWSKSNNDATPDRKRRNREDDDGDYEDSETPVQKRNKHDHTPATAQRHLRSNSRANVDVTQKWGTSDLSVWHNKF